MVSSASPIPSALPQQARGSACHPRPASCPSECHGFRFTLEAKWTAAPGSTARALALARDLSARLRFFFLPPVSLFRAPALLSILWGSRREPLRQQSEHESHGGLPCLWLSCSSHSAPAPGTCQACSSSGPSNLSPRLGRSSWESSHSSFSPVIWGSAPTSPPHKGPPRPL